MRRARAFPALALASLLALLPASGLAAPVAMAPASPQATRLSIETAMVPGQDLGSGGVEVTRVSPVVPGPQDPVTITGVLDVEELGIDLTPPTLEPTASPTAAPETPDLADPAPDPVVASVDVRLGAARIQSHEDVTAWVESSSPSAGAVLARADVRAAGQTGAGLPFTVTVEDLGPSMTSAYGVLPISIEFSRPGDPGPSRALHTFLGYQVVKEYAPLGLSWIVPITVPADLLLVGEFGSERTAAWERLVGPDGMLRSRLAAAAATGGVWVLDPALLGPGPVPEAEGDPGAGGGTTAGSTPGTSGSGTSSPGTSGSGTSSPRSSGPQTPGTTNPGPTGTATPTDPDQPPDWGQRERELRADFADALFEGAAGRDVLLLPRHDADISTLPDTGESGAAPEAVRTLLASSLAVADAHERLTEAGARVLPTLWPADPVWSAERADALQPLPEVGPAAPGQPVPWSVLAVPASVSATVTGPAQLPGGGAFLPIDGALSERAGGLAREADALTGGLALMADSLVTLNDRPGTSRHVLVALERRFAAEDALVGMATVLEQVPWLESAALPEASGTADLIPQAPEAGPESAEGPTSDQETSDQETSDQETSDQETSAEPVLTGERAVDLVRTLDRLPTAASVRIDSGEDLGARGPDTLAQLTSVRWRGAPEDWSAAYSPIAEQVDATFSSLHIPARDIAFLADTGLVRVTVENSLDEGISNATLQLNVDHPILRIENGPQPVEIGAESRSTVAFQASAIASGRVSVTAVVRAADGTYLSEPTTFTVRVSPTSDWIYWVLGAVALGVILLGIARMALRQRPVSEDVPA